MKQKEPKHIDKDFQKNFKKLYKLTKPRSPLCIEFMTEDLPDEWFIDIVKYRKKSGVVTEHFMILQKDLEDWINSYKKDGFKLLTED